MKLVRTLALATTLSLSPILLEPAAAVVEQFAITYGDTVSDGVPAPGSGNLEQGGDQDAYTFSATAGDDVILDVLTGGAGTYRWTVVSPSGTTLVAQGLFTDRRFALTESGTYTATVSGATATSTGPYAFRLLLVPPPEVFAVTIGDTIDVGIPGPGAGHIESPGATDVYSFDGVGGQDVVLDVLAGQNVFIHWTLTAPDGSVVFDSFIGDRGVTLPTSGTYVLTLGGNGLDDTGSYSFRLLGPPPPDRFAVTLGVVVSDGVPGPGAGNIESPGATDVYTFGGGAGQDVDLDVLAGDNVAIHWALVAPDGSMLLDTFIGDATVTLPAMGIYTLTLSGNGADDTGTYSFQLVAAAGSDDFEIAYGDTISDGVPGPGAGNIETAFATDRYHFEGTAGDVVRFEVLGVVPEAHWNLVGPAGPLDPFFDGDVHDMHEVTLPTTGTYTLSVTDDRPVTYSIRLTATVPTPDPSVDVLVLAACLHHDRPGLIPVVIFGNDDVAVDRIDRRTVELGGMPILRLFGWPLAVIADVDRDGHDDLVAVIRYVPGTLPAGPTTVALTASLYDGTTISGSAAVDVR